MKIDKRFFVWVTVAVVVGGLVWRTFIASPSKPVATGGPLDIKLVAIRPDMGEVCYDPAGKKLDGVTFPLLPVDRAVWGKDEICMDFIFEIPDGKEMIPHNDFMSVFDGDRKLNRTVRNLGGWPHPFFRQVVYNGKKLLIVHHSFQSHYNKKRKFLKFIKWKTTEYLTHVDLELNYLHGPSQYDHLGDKGPFKPGDKKFLSGSDKLMLEINDDEIDATGIANANFQTASNPKRLIAYDMQGQRHVVSERLKGKKSPTQRLSDCYVEGLSISQIKSIGSSASSHRRIFKNINVSFPGRKKRCYAPFIDEMAQRLGIERTPDDYKKIIYYDYKDWQEAIKVLDVARGNMLRKACHKICSSSKFDASKLDDQTRQFVHQTLVKKLNTYDRLYAIRIGLKFGFEDFVDIALDTFEGKKREYYVAIDDRTGSQYIDERYGKLLFTFERLTSSKVVLNAEQLGRVKNVILKTGSYAARNQLFRTILRSADTNKEAALAMLIELAEDDRIWIWWHALDYLYSIDRKPQKPADVSETVEKRFELFNKLYRRQSLAQIDKDILTIDFAVACPDTFLSVTRRIAEHMERRQALDQFMSYLEKAMKEVNTKNFNELNRTVRCIVAWLKVIDKRDSQVTQARKAENFYIFKPKDVPEFKKKLTIILKEYQAN
ncbi:MAG: hypothetical protein K9M75_13410 [Phycisphaerae bacterium]|nr:hypothetical protein [Phycisphaerae bacterium]